MKRVLYFLLAGVLTVGMIWLLLRYVSIGEIYAAARRLPVQVVVGACVLYLLAYPMKSLRFSALLNRRLTWVELLPTTAVHHFFNSMLPARLGEASFPYLLRKRIKMMHSATVLLAARLLDTIVVTLFFVVSSLAGGVPDPFFPMMTIATIFLGLVLVITAIIFLAPGVFVRIVRPFVTPLMRYALVRRMWLAFEDFPTYIHDMRGNLWLAFVGTIGYWLANYAMTAVVLKSLGWTLSITQIWMGATLSFLTAVLPVQGFAGLGTLEGAWTAVFLGLGVTLTTAITGAFVLHGLQLLCLIVYGAIGFAAYVRWRPKATLFRQL